ncbi:MAG: putative spermidine/putrescine transport system substrate-binding protein [Clostridiales bacterium]|nr:putative spermidine/putrescine transport system substrate-binding protein [Clostridiales bacterium]MDK2934238.1 putative spermidine/putrescine transport system substrate-binding protein [Clostridiales bacterium]
MKKVLMVVLIVLSLILNLVACGQSNISTGTDVLEKDWNAILKEAKGTTVHFYGWGGDQRINRWIDTYLASRLKEEYNITLNRVPMNIEDILNNLLGEKQLNTVKGNMDIVWINGENFYTAKKNGLLFGPFTDKLPNLKKYVDTDSVEVNYDFGFPVEGYEAPYGKAQLVMIYDEAKLDKVPADHKQLFAMVKNNPGQFTYPAPPDFTGSAFVRNIIYDIVGYEQFMKMEADKETIKKEIQPAIDYLKELKPYLWKEGKSYPATIAQLDNMYADNEVLMSMSYNPNSAEGKVQIGAFPKTTKTFVFENGTIGNTHFLAVPFNAPNKAGALAVIDFILSVEAQASKYDPKNWGDLPVLDNAKLTQKEKEMFESIDIGGATIPQVQLLEKRVPEMPANLIPIIEEIWLENIPEGE